MNPLDQVMSTKEASQIWGLSQERVKALCREGKLKAKRIGYTWIIDRSQKNPKQVERK